MGLREWIAKRGIKDPVRGLFRCTDWYDKMGNTWLTGVITAPGMPAFPARARTDGTLRWTQTVDFPVAVDRSNPNRFAILWEEIALQSPGTQEWQSAQQAAARFNAAGAPEPAVPSAEPSDAPPAPVAYPASRYLANMQAWPSDPARGFAGTPERPGTAVPTTATVRSVTDIPGGPWTRLEPAAAGGTADVTFDVAVPGAGRQGFARLKFATPERRAEIQPGRSFPALFDPATGYLRLISTGY